jgi:hypothetical protein
MSKSAEDSPQRLEKDPASIKYHTFKAMLLLLNQDAHAHPIIYYILNLF